MLAFAVALDSKAGGTQEQKTAFDDLFPGGGGRGGLWFAHGLLHSRDTGCTQHGESLCPWSRSHDLLNWKHSMQPSFNKPDYILKPHVCPHSLKPPFAEAHLYTKAPEPDSLHFRSTMHLSNSGQSGGTMVRAVKVVLMVG